MGMGRHPSTVAQAVVAVIAVVAVMGPGAPARAVATATPPAPATAPAKPLVDVVARASALTGVADHEIEFCLDQAVVCTVAAATAMWATTDTYRRFGTSGHSGGPDDEFRHGTWAYRARQVLDAMRLAGGDELDEFFRHHEQGGDPWCMYGDPPSTCHPLTQQDLAVDRAGMRRARSDARSARAWLTQALPAWP